MGEYLPPPHTHKKTSPFFCKGLSLSESQPPPRTCRSPRSYSCKMTNGGKNAAVANGNSTLTPLPANNKSLPAEHKLKETNFV